jgi:hypothetical protein
MSAALADLSSRGFRGFEIISTRASTIYEGWQVDGERVRLRECPQSEMP